MILPTFVASGGGTVTSPLAGDKYVNPDGSCNAVYGSSGWSSGLCSPAPTTIAVQTVQTNMATSPTLVASESATVAYYSDGNYYNPQTGAMYGSTPPAGAWPVPQDPTYTAYVTQALANQPSQGAQATTVAGATGTTNTSVNAQQTQPTTTGSTAVQSNTATAASTAPVASSTTVNSGSLSDLLNEGETWLAANPLLALAGLAVLIFAITSGGEEHARR